MELKDNLNDSWQACKKYIKYQPWILWLDDNTELLASLENNNSHIASTLHLDWYVSSKSVILKPKVVFSDDDWQTLNHFLKQKRQFGFINSTVMVIPAQQILNNSATLPNALLKCLHKPLALTLLISGCEKIAGFNSFFGNLTVKEKNELLGISSSAMSPDIQTELGGQLSQLRQAIGGRLIRRLHREQTALKRQRITNFTLQLAELNEKINSLFAELDVIDSVHCQGIYFVGKQDQTTQQSLHVKVHPDNFPPHYLFSGDLLSVLTKRANTPLMSSQPTPWSRWLALPIAASIIASFTLLLHHDYKQSVNALNTVSGNIKTYSVVDNNNSLSWINTLTALRDTQSNLANTKTRSFYLIGLPHVSDLKKLAKNRYNNLLREKFSSYLDSTLRAQLLKNISGNKLQLLRVLTAYLSLTDSKHFDRNKVSNWFVHYWRHQYQDNPKLQEALTFYFNQLFTLPNLQWQQDKNLVTQAQATLQKTNPALLSLLVLRDSFPDDQTSILPNAKPISGINLQNAKMPTVYSAHNFKKIVNNDIPNIDSLMQKYAWVIGNNVFKSLAAAEKTALISDVQKLYLDNYTQAWLAAIPNIHLTTPQSFADVNTTIKLLTDKNSTLIQLLNVIIGNATLAIKDVKALSSDKSFIAINDFTQKIGRYKTIQKNLLNLQKLVNRLDQSSTPDKASYDMAVSRFKNPKQKNAISQLLKTASSAADPVRQWLERIALSAWGVILQNTQNYISAVWSTTVYPQYNQLIANKYPIFHTAKATISYKDFTAFFGPTGQLKQFFNQYLSPFVNLSGNYWTWKKVNGLSISFSQKSLNMLLRGSLIQQMFYTADPAAPNMRFDLVPVQLSKTINSLTINIDQQLYTVTSASKTPLTFVWPNGDAKIVTLRFDTTATDNPIITVSGPWAWLRLMDQAKVQTTANPQLFLVTFSTDNHNATFRLIAGNRINPYLPNILTAFRCPKML